MAQSGILAAGSVNGSSDRTGPLADQIGNRKTNILKENSSSPPSNSSFAPTHSVRPVLNNVEACAIATTQASRPHRWKRNTRPQRQKKEKKRGGEKEREKKNWKRAVREHTPSPSEGSERRLDWLIAVPEEPRTLRRDGTAFAKAEADASRSFPKVTTKFPGRSAASSGPSRFARGASQSRSQRKMVLKTRLLKHTDLMCS